MSLQTFPNGVNVKFCGKVFHRPEAAARKARSSMVENQRSDDGEEVEMPKGLDIGRLECFEQRNQRRKPTEKKQPASIWNTRSTRFADCKCSNATFEHSGNEFASTRPRISAADPKMERGNKPNNLVVSDITT